MIVTFPVLVVSSLIAATIYFLYRRLQFTTRQNRALLFDNCDNLLDDSERTYEKSGFPNLSGTCDGFNVKLELVPDTIVMRKIPPLWLMVTIKGNKKSQGNLDFIVRPQNSEFYSPGWYWDGVYQVPENWPQHSIAKYSGSTASIATLDRFVPALFEDIKVKELLVTPEIVRITYMAKQADRGEYLLMREAVFDKQIIDKSSVKGIIEQAILIRKNIEEDCHYE